MFEICIAGGPGWGGRRLVSDNKEMYCTFRITLVQGGMVRACVSMTRHDMTLLGGQANKLDNDVSSRP